MVLNLRLNQLGEAEGNLLKLEIDPNLTPLGRVVNKNLWIKEELVNSIKNFKTLNLEKN